MNKFRLFGVVIVGLITASLLGLMVYFYGSSDELPIGTDGLVEMNSKEKSDETEKLDNSVELDEMTKPNDSEKTNEAQEQDNRSIEGRFKVLNVYDGDTFAINYNGVLTSVRIIGVNTPETVDPRKTVECFGEQASLYLSNKLLGKEVELERDYTQDNRDKYNRLLRYVYLNDEDVGYDIIYHGYGYEYTYYIPYKKQIKYKEAERDAEQNNRGLWMDGVCGL